MDCFASLAMTAVSLPYPFLTPDSSTTSRQRSVPAASVAPNSVVLPVIGMASSSAMR
jgi:hypothetical protein